MLTDRTGCRTDTAPRRCDVKTPPTRQIIDTSVLQNYNGGVPGSQRGNRLLLVALLLPPGTLAWMGPREKTNPRLSVERSTNMGKTTLN